MASWTEPTRRVPLRWGGWGARSWGGLTLIVSGGVALAGSSAANIYPLLLGVLGATAHLLGWAVLPAAGWRRVVVMIPSLFAVVTVFPGPRYLAVLAIPLLCWLVVRHRPLRVAPFAAFVVATGVVLARIFPVYDGMLVASAVALFVVVGAAWAARAVHAASSRPRRTLRRNRSIRS